MEKKLPTLKEIEDKYEPEELKDLTDEEVLKVFEGVETVWDHNPTEEELMGLGLRHYEFDDDNIAVDRVMTKTDYFRVYSYSEENFIIDIRTLFILREDEQSAEKYFNLLPKKIQESILEDELSMTCGFGIDFEALESSK